MTLTRKLAFTFLILIFIILTGTIGFSLLEGWSWFDSLYMTFVTVATVGYGDFVPVTTGGRFFAIFLIVFGVGAMLYSAGLYAETMFEGRIRLILGREKLERAIARLNDHYIICGCGRIGYLICRELADAKVPFVVVEKNQEVLQKAVDDGFIYYRGDATDDKALICAGIRRAKGIVCALPTDAQNLYVILTAKELNPDIYVLSRSEEEASESRLIRAGADRVISPYAMGGMRMAMAILRPAMLDFFMELATKSHHLGLSTQGKHLELPTEEFAVGEGSALIGQSLEVSSIRGRYGLIVVAIKKDTGKIIFNPLTTYVIERGDNIIVMGDDAQLSRFSELCKG